MGPNVSYLGPDRVIEGGWRVSGSETMHVGRVSSDEGFIMFHYRVGFQD